MPMIIIIFLGNYECPPEGLLLQSRTWVVYSMVHWVRVYGNSNSYNSYSLIICELLIWITLKLLFEVLWNYYYHLLFYSINYNSKNYDFVPLPSRYRSKMNAPVSKKAILDLHKSKKTLNDKHIILALFLWKMILNHAKRW